MSTPTENRSGCARSDAPREPRAAASATEPPPWGSPSAWVLPLKFDGGSAIYDPEGRLLAEVGDGDGVVSWQFDRELLEETRRAHSLLADVRAPAPVSQFEVM